ncbi:hypothetical protein JCM10135_11730 [Stetteria hydrogenophila]
MIESGRLRKVYRLTDKGWSALADALDVAKAITENMLHIINLAAERVRARSAQGTRKPCVPAEVLNHLYRLEETVKRLSRALEERACREEGS